jgi:hypothetical protein
MKELRGGQHTHQRKTIQSKHVLMVKSQLDFSKSCSDATSLKPTNLLPVTIATAAPHAASLCNCQCVAVATCHGHNPQVRVCGQVGTQGYVLLQDKVHTHNGLVKYRIFQWYSAYCSMPAGAIVQHAGSLHVHEPLRQWQRTQYCMLSVPGPGMRKTDGTNLSCIRQLMAQLAPAAQSPGQKLPTAGDGGRVL